ncbi:MAG: hypothetical protein BWY05_01592 [Euryarchaeota archaeon ADurb.Bin165]|nr:MAG: hypothetical protein BWY05_01592 [Euryarchaeota archaeon ADurb.Bin165]
MNPFIESSSSGPDSSISAFLAVEKSQYDEISLNAAFSASLTILAARSCLLTRDSFLGLIKPVLLYSGRSSSASPIVIKDIPVIVFNISRESRTVCGVNFCISPACTSSRILRAMCWFTRSYGVMLTFSTVPGSQIFSESPDGFCSVVSVSSPLTLSSQSWLSKMIIPSTRGFIICRFFIALISRDSPSSSAGIVTRAKTGSNIVSLMIETRCGTRLTSPPPSPAQTRIASCVPMSKPFSFAFTSSIVNLVVSSSGDSMSSFGK